MALARNDVSSSAPSGYGPADLRSAYNLVSAAATGGSGQQVALLEVGDDPNAVPDFNAYRLRYGLPACDSTTEAGCLTVVNTSGQASPLPPANPKWAVQSSMDADTVAAICPNCQVLLVEAASPAGALNSLGTIYRASQARIAVAGFGDRLLLSGPTSPYASVGFELVAAAGDDGYGVQYPAYSRFVTAVGGTTLVPAATARGWAETVWAGTGSGCVTREFKSPWQHDAGCAGRTQNDVAALADPETGVSFYDTDQSGGWGVGGGTNVSADIVAATYALAGTPETATLPAEYPYRSGGGLYPVTSGSNGTCDPAYLCTAADGYNGPAGLGTPDGTAAFTAPSGNVVTMFTLNTSGNTGLGKATGAVIFAFDTSPTAAMTFSANVQPAGLTVAVTTHACMAQTSPPETACRLDVIGTAPTAGIYHVSVTAADDTGASESDPLIFDVQDTVTLTLPSRVQDAVLGTTKKMPVTATSASGQELDFSVTGLPPGLAFTRTGPDQIAITGRPAKPGSWTSTVTASNPAGGSATGLINWQVHGTITVRPQPNLTSSAGGAAVITLSAVDSVKGVHVDFGATGLPPGISQPLGKDYLLYGWPKRPGTYHVSVVAGDQYGAATTLKFTWTVRDDTTARARGPIRLDFGKCLDAAKGPRIWPCNGTKSQVWKIAQDGTIRTGSECLTESGTKFKSRVVLARCTDAASQQWQLQTSSNQIAYVDGRNNTPFLVNAASGRCLNDAGGNRDGAGLDIVGCNTGNNDTWLTPAAPIDSSIPGMCLADPGDRTANGTRLVLWKCDGSAKEKFTVEPDSTIRVHGKCLYANPATTKNGVPVVLATCRVGYYPGEDWSILGAAPFAGAIVSHTGENLGIAGSRAVNGTPVGTYFGGLDWRLF